MKIQVEVVVGHDGVDFPNGYLKHMKKGESKWSPVMKHDQSVFQMIIQESWKKECSAIFAEKQTRI